MVNYTTNDFKSGLKIILDKSPHVIIENEFVKPGKGQAFSRVKLKHLLSGKILDKTFKSGESFVGADVSEIPMQYLYREGETFYFMDPKTFEQTAVPLIQMQEALPWLLGEEICVITLWDRAPITVQPPTFVELKVRETDPGLKGDTVSGGGKPAILETGATVRVPLFIQAGEKIKVDTRTGSYISRVQRTSPF